MTLLIFLFIAYKKLDIKKGKNLECATVKLMFRQSIFKFYVFNTFLGNGRTNNLNSINMCFSVFY